MKKVIKFLPAMAILLGSGLAMGSHALFLTPNVKNVAPGSAPPVWVSISPGETVNCNDNTYRQCKAHMDSTGISNIVYGDRTF